MINERGLNLIKAFEGCRLEAYQDQGGVWTIGYGRTLGVKPGDVCIQLEADAWLLSDLAVAEKAVKRQVVVNLNENQLAALISFVYNCGAGNFERSTLLRCVNKHEWETAAKALMLWDKVNGVQNLGLVRRRAAESRLFLTSPMV